MYTPVVFSTFTVLGNCHLCLVSETLNPCPPQRRPLYLLGGINIILSGLFQLHDPYGAKIETRLLQLCKNTLQTSETVGLLRKCRTGKYLSLTNKCHWGGQLGLPWQMIPRKIIAQRHMFSCCLEAS